MIENEPLICDNIAKILLPKDYIRYRLTGKYTTEVSDASGTGYFNLKERARSYELLDILDHSKAWLPRCYESLEIAGVLSDAVADGLGLPRRLPVVGGGRDAVIQTIGAGVVTNRIALTLIGTAGNLMVSLPCFSHDLEGRFPLFCHVLPNKWVALGCTLTAGSALRWFKDTLGGLEVKVAKELQKSVYEILDQEAARAPVGSHSLLFLPYLIGERCRHTDPDARGTIIGLDLHHTRFGHN